MKLKEMPLYFKSVQVLRKLPSRKKEGWVPRGRATSNPLKSRGALQAVTGQRVTSKPRTRNITGREAIQNSIKRINSHLFLSSATPKTWNSSQKPFSNIVAPS
jgi:hypothetical protein